MNWGELVGPAVVAAVVSGVIAVVGMLVNRSTTLATHREKLEADQKLAERKFEFDKDLAERKVRLDRELADWRRRVELAEQVLADFYKAREIFIAARNPFAFVGEGATRARQPSETEQEAQNLDAMYAPYERLLREKDFLSELHAKRFQFMAVFGNDSAASFTTFVKAFNEIGFATRALLNSHQRLNDKLREKYETTIGWGLEEEDPIKHELDQAVGAIEAVCLPVLAVRPV